MRLLDRLIILTSSLAAVTMLPSVASAETVKWAVKPEYKSIKPMEKDGFFKVKKGYRYGIADMSGRLVVPATCDSITDFVDGYALALVWMDDHFRLTKIIDEEGNTSTIADEYFVGDYPFFSDGKLPVYNSKGRYGYVDTSGRLVVDFKYADVHPFSEGLAAVTKGRSRKKDSPAGIGKDKVFYIDENGRELKLQSDIGDIYFGSTFSNGEALVANKKGRFFTIDPSGRMLGILSDVAMTFDGKFRWSESVEPEKARGKRKGNISGSSITAFDEGGKWGYRDGMGKVIVPPQFIYAAPVEGGYSVVKTDSGEYGMLAFVDGEYTCRKAKASMTPKDSDHETFDYTVSIPSSCEGAEVCVYVIDCSGNRVDASGSTSSKDGSMVRNAFSVTKGNHVVEVASDALVVYRGRSESVGDADDNDDDRNGKGSSADIKLAVTPTSVKANLKDIAEVKVTVYNNSGSSKTLPVSVNGKEASASVSSITVPAGGKKTFSVALKRVVTAEKRKLTVSVGKKTIARDINVKPIFD